MNMSEASYLTFLIEAGISAESFNYNIQTQFLLGISTKINKLPILQFDQFYEQLFIGKMATLSVYLH